MKFDFIAERTSWKHKIANFLATHFKSIRKGYLGRQRFILICWIYRILPFFGFEYCRLIEWQFILRYLPKNKKLKILDVGCTASLFIYELAKRGETFGIDSRPYFENLPKKIKFLQCDVSKMPFPDNYFNCITLISVIEHVGLGAYKDSVYDDGDFKSMEELRRALQVGGMIFVTTLVGNKYILSYDSSERIYDEKRFDELIGKFFVEKEEYYIFRKRWIPVAKRKAFQESPQRFGLACLLLTKK